MKSLKHTILLLLIFTQLPVISKVHTSIDNYIIKGTVCDKETDERLPFVSIILSANGKKDMYTQSDANGNFRFKNIIEGSYQLKCNLIGYKEYTITFDVRENKNLKISLSSQSYTLNDIVVTASESQGITSASRIDRDAMKHLQPSSFTDLLSLLPGG